MISRFFIDHPIFASVISIVIALAGLTAMRNLPVEQYPNITPPQIVVSASFNGANAETMANDVASPLEQQILGAENMIYMYSQNSSTGNTNLQIYFALGSDANVAQIHVQNLANQALSQLPQQVQAQGVTITKQTPNILMVVAIQSPSDRYDSLFMSNYAQVNVVNELELLPGISTISTIGQRNYAMRIWLRPDIMAQMGITTSEVINAVNEQNTDFGIGQVGQAPNSHPVSLTVPMGALGRLATPEQFEEIIVRADINGAIVRLKDIGSVELGAQNYVVDGSVNGKPAILLAIYQQYGANAIDVADSVKTAMKRISKRFPHGLEYSVPYDTTTFVQISIEEVVQTIIEATILVVIVMFIFLQNLRVTLIPFMALLVSLLGAFAGIWVIGYSINTLTLFAMVLAIGIVVDDAIVVAENVERNLRMLKLSPRDAARKAMDEVTAPVVAIVFVLCAVFIPIAFLGGIAGQLYKQFAITITISVFFSGLVALTLSPAIAAIVLKPHEKTSKAADWFNRGLEKVTDGYIKIASWVIHHTVPAVITFCLLVGLLLYFFKTTPTGFVPMEDQGYVIGLAYLPDGASLDRNAKVSDQIYKICMQNDAVENVVSLTGFSLIESIDRTNVAAHFITLKPWSERKKKSQHAAAVIQELNKAFRYTIQDAGVLAVSPPAIQGLGTVGGFEFWIENRGDGGNKALELAVKNFLAEAKKRPELGTIRSTAEFDNMQFFLDLDRNKAKCMGVAIADVFQALQAFFGAYYINNFNKFGLVYQVLVQAEPSYREKPENLRDIYVRSSSGEMVPITTLVSVKYQPGPNLITRFNDFTASHLIGGPAKGYSTGQAIKAMEELAKTLPEDMYYGWSGQAYQEIASGGTSSVAFIAGLVMVFLILSALYEKWSLPFAIILIVPFGTLGAFIAIRLLGMSNDVYFQIGLVTLIALSAKNSILIVEFALMKMEEGLSVYDAALEAAKLRFRAIIMTSLVFICGVLPLVFSSGAGAASRHSVGVGVLGGMIAATTFALCFVPLFFVLCARKIKVKKREELK
ncbi:MAG: multidrug efflux RND transporter permease subunit [Verrucomicrobia bacterium]|nr:multidrug efflux RND transporter permease subunit [Verrucomicrobiota bacterium]